MTLRVIVEAPPPGVIFGVQKGQGSSYETIDARRSEGEDLTFEARYSLKNLDHARPPVLTGPFVYRGASHRSLCLDIGTAAGDSDSPWSRRAGIPLPEASWDLFDELLARPGSLLEARIPGTGRDGGPVCATVWPVGGWRCVEAF